MFGEIRLRLFGISPSETSIETRGFTVTDTVVKEQLETIGAVFVEGYHAALLQPEPETLSARLNQIEPELTGFAYEGAGMGLALLDMLTPWPSHRLQRFLDGPGNHHYYMIHVGVGWAMARLHRRTERFLPRLDPVVGWLAVEGYGFHEAYFYASKTVDKQERPKQMTGYAKRAFDQGIGRCLWFVCGSDVERIVTTIVAFARERQPDLWAGVGLSSTYAGGVDPDVLHALATAAGPYLPQLAQGATFAAKTRTRAGNPAAHTDLACRVFCKRPLNEVVDVFDAADPALAPSRNGSAPPPNGSEPTYETWRRNIQAQFTHEEVFA